jgi:predicted RNA-binding Zn-ribbon protein involved in translation (DUF1610 family)
MMRKIATVEVEKIFVCPNCGGAKKIEGKECQVCEGTGTILKSAPSRKVGDSFTKDAGYV